MQPMRTSEGLGAVSATHHDHELVSAESHHRVIGAGGDDQELGDAHQDPVSDLVAIRVVDELEVVEIDEGNADVVFMYS